ncbi:MAG: hypothetical protein JO208_06580 [Alphaproteobacteria bacterium]|nr:hypothetical protein [Alphaproteobacteria bacterium]
MADLARLPEIFERLLPREQVAPSSNEYRALNAVGVFTRACPRQPRLLNFREAVMQKIFVLALLALALAGGVATVSTLTATPAAHSCEGVNC